jgi:hypothetical protein
MYVHFVYSAKIPKQLTNCLKRAEASEKAKAVMGFKRN